MPAALAVVIALVAAIGLATPAPACSLDGSAGGGVSNVVKAIGTALGLTTSAGAATGKAGNTSATSKAGHGQSVAAASPGLGGGAGRGGLGEVSGGGSGSGGSFGAGGSFGSSVSQATPHNPSADHAFSATPQDKLAESNQSAEVTFALAPEPADGGSPATAAFIASAQASEPALRTEPWPVAMASPATEPDPVSFETDETAVLASPRSPGGWLLAAALVGVGVIASGWAWRSLGDD